MTDDPPGYVRIPYGKDRDLDDAIDLAEMWLEPERQPGESMYVQEHDDAVVATMALANPFPWLSMSRSYEDSLDDPFADREHTSVLWPDGTVSHLADILEDDDWQ
jgi:hypothetical protein